MKLYTDTVSFHLSFLHPNSFTCLAVVAPELMMKFNLIVTSSNTDDLLFFCANLLDLLTTLFYFERALVYFV